MSDSMLMQAKSHRAELTREAGQGRLAARMRPERKSPARTPSRPSRPGGWLATAIAWLRPARGEDGRHNEPRRERERHQENGARNDTVITEKAGSER
jgi:hypothetical protein